MKNLITDNCSLPSAWHPSSFARRQPYLAVRQRVIAALRNVFAADDFAEVETPALQISPGGEVHLAAFATELKDAQTGASQTMYLHTSPELAMKKLLVAGVPKLYQLARVFRNGERSSRHHPEFLMLEWYRGQGSGGRDQGSEGADETSPSRPCGRAGQGKSENLLDTIKQDCITLTRAAASAANKKTFTANNMNCDPFQEWESLTVPDAFMRYAGIDILATAPDPHAPDAALLAKEARSTGIRITDGDSWDDIFFRVMGEKIEPFLGKDRPVFLCDYPVSMAALARPKPSDPRLAERFELYICGIELANAFGELTDADEQERRFKADMALKEKLYGQRYPVDMDFIAALRHGMPESAGIALGVDRLVMLCAGTENIDDVLWLPVVEAGG